MNLAEKIKILDALASGEKISFVARRFNINESTVDQAMEIDPIMTRSLQFKQDCEKAIQNYKILYKDLMRRAKQTRLTDYFSQNK